MTHPLRILIADDNLDAAESLGALLNLNGHEVRTACNGREALELARSWSPDAAILDLAMPVMNGFEAAEAIRRETEVPLLVALSGWGGQDVELGAKNAGFDLVLCKGDPFEELATALRLAAEERPALPAVAYAEGRAKLSGAARSPARL
jgi:CheY-like chemotaxis protein